MTKVAPCGSLSVMMMEPPWLSTTSVTIARPSPCRGVAGACGIETHEPLEDSQPLVERDAGSVVGDLRFTITSPFVTLAVMC